MSTFDPARIVPSLRDALAALSTQRKSLALLPWVSSADSGALAAEATRLEAMDVRALAIGSGNSDLVAAVRATKSTPIIALDPISTAEQAQRARYFGTDAVVLSPCPQGELAPLIKTVQSMRMNVIGHCKNNEDIIGFVNLRVRMLYCSCETVKEQLALSALAPPRILVLARVKTLTSTDLELLNGKVDAVVVENSVHQAPTFEALLNSLDG